MGEDELEDGVSALAVSMVDTQNMENENYLPTRLLYFWMDTLRTHNGVLKGCIPTSVLSGKCGSKLLLMDEGVKIYMSQSVSNCIPGQVPGPGVVDQHKTNSVGSCGCFCFILAFFFGLVFCLYLFIYFVLVFCEVFLSGAE